jgi:GH43 family beta-xylosidase
VRATETHDDFYNVLLPDGADPWVYRHTDGCYYLTGTTGRDITLRRARTLSGLGAGERRVVWSPPPGGPNSRNLWAPELHFLGGRWYVYYAADDGHNRNHRMYALECASPDPFRGTFRDRGRLRPPGDDLWAIDGTVLAVGGELYFVWSGWSGRINVRQNLYIAPMADPLTLAGPRVEISRPSFAWETHGRPQVNEAPQALVRNGSVHIIYSASGAWTDHYCLGRLTARRGSDLLTPGAWAKHPEPVFAGAGGVVSPGHASFTRSPDDTEDWIIYHSARFRGAGFRRRVHAQSFRWSEDDTPDFGVPASPDTPLPLPSGEAPRVRVAHQGMGDAYLAELARSLERPRAKGKVEDALAGGAPFTAAAFTVSVEADGFYALVLHYRHGVAGETIRYRAAVNGRECHTLAFPFTDASSNALMRVKLRRGENRIELRASGGPAIHLHSLDVFRADGD